MIAAATRVRAANNSFRNSQPRKTAITGLTYAYVATSDVGAFLSNHTYEANPIHEPTVIR